MGPISENGDYQGSHYPTSPTESNHRNESSTLSDYTLGDCLGRGASGSVYRALNWTTGQTVAIKQIRLSDLPRSELRVIMLEIDLLKNLNHPNIVQYQGFVKSADSLYIILEFCENGSLYSICKNFGKFPEHLVGMYMTQILHGLLYLHDQGVIHRDIKGANILTTKDGLIKLADFGVATRANDSSVVGTPYWMAPEVIELVGATTASDIWSVGCTVIELLEGNPPYHHLAPMPALFRIVNDDHPPLPDGASPAVRDFLMQCFQKDPNLRVSARKLLKHPWIVNSKRPDPVTKQAPTKYDEAVKSVQQWNEALKKPLEPQVQKPKPNTLQSDVPKQDQEVRENFTSLQESSLDDNWDDDFTTSINTSSFELAHFKPQDVLAGQFSADELKSMSDATTKAAQRVNRDEVHFGPLSKTKPRIPNEEDMETIKPHKFNLLRSASTAYERPIPKSNHNGNISNAFEKSTFMPGSWPPSVPLFSEDADLESDFEFEPRKPKSREYEDKSAPTSPIYRDRFNSSFVEDEAYGTGRLSMDMNRSPTKSRIRTDDAFLEVHTTAEITKYTEMDEEEDFSDISWAPELSLGKQKSPEKRTELKLTPKRADSSLGLAEEYEDDDPFAELEEGFSELDLDANIARDKHARLCTEVASLIDSLKSQHTGEDLEDITTRLLNILLDSPDTKGAVIAAHGLLPILEVLESSRNRDVNLTLLKVINSITFNDIELLENLCFVGAIPTISKFASKRYSKEIRLEAAIFIRQICHMSRLTLQMFVSCGGLNVLVELIEEDYSGQKDLVLTGIEGVVDVFKLQGSTPKNDFCRILSRNMLLHPLSLVLSQICKEKQENSEESCLKIVNIFFVFSQAENQVKEVIADRMTLKRVLKDLQHLPLACQITMLKFIKNLSMLSTTLDTLQNANAIEVLTEMLSENIHNPQYKELSNQILSITFNLCRHSKSRQEEAAINGIVPLLQRIVRTERPLKELALPILCDMAHSGKVGRKYLWQHRGLEFFVSLLSEPYWQVAALEAILVWLQEEPARVEEKLLHSKSIKALIGCFTGSKANTFENLLEPFQKLCRLSSPIAQAIGQPDLFERTLQKLTHPKAVVRLNLLRIIRSICDASKEQEELLTRSGLFPMILWLAENDGAVLVRNMAGEFARKIKQQKNSLPSTPFNLRPTTSPASSTSMRSGLSRSSSSASRSTTSKTQSISLSETLSTRRSDEKTREGGRDVPVKAKQGLKFERRRRKQSS